MKNNTQRTSLINVTDKLLSKISKKRLFELQYGTISALPKSMNKALSGHPARRILSLNNAHK